MDKNNLLKLAIEIYGKDAQIMVAIEECSELIQAICKLYRDPDTYMRREAVVDEIADVTIMCEQLRLIFGAGQVDKRIEYKLNRLEKRLNASLEATTDDKEYICGTTKQKCIYCQPCCGYRLEGGTVNE